jgi:hypothetical protein
MAQLDIFLSEVDLESLLALALSRGAVLVPDTRYATDKYDEIADLAPMRRFRPAVKLFFILHQSYLVTPLEMRQTRSEENSAWYIMQRNGGPTIDIFCPGQKESGDRRIIGQGYVGYYPTFWNPRTGRNETASPALKAYYALLTKHIRTHAARVALPKRTFWIGLDALRLARLGWSLPGIPLELIP